MKRLTVCLLLIAAISASTTAASSSTPPEHVRGAEQTFLTFPEWYLVHSPAEFAQFLAARKRPSEFPWGTHIAQFWQGYRGVTHETADYPFNAGYHLMVSVIGASTTVEYALRAGYESTVGRITEASASGSPTSEDDLAARVAQSYVDFIRAEPWYLFDFGAPLRELWTKTPITGVNLLRKWERRFALTTEYAVKAGYAWLIKLGSQSIYEEARPVTAVVLSAVPQHFPNSLPNLERISSTGRSAVFTVPRYRAFMFYAQALADEGIDFQEIAGNRGEILVSVIAREEANLFMTPARLVLTQPLVTQPPRKRQLIAVPVSQLSEHLRRWRHTGVELEHIYDY